MKGRRSSFLASFVAFACAGLGAHADASTEPPVAVVYPLTGLPVDDEATLGRPALVIPIDNWGERVHTPA